MKILLTNDDGIQSEGLMIVAKWAKKLGDVTVSAPKFEQSGKSHSIDIHNPFEVKKSIIWTEYARSVWTARRQIACALQRWGFTKPTTLSYPA